MHNINTWNASTRCENDEKYRKKKSSTHNKILRSLTHSLIHSLVIFYINRHKDTHTHTRTHGARLCMERIRVCTSHCTPLICRVRFPIWRLMSCFILFMWIEWRWTYCMYIYACYAMSCCIVANKRLAFINGQMGLACYCVSIYRRKKWSEKTTYTHGEERERETKSTDHWKGKGKRIERMREMRIELENQSKRWLLLLLLCFASKRLHSLIMCVCVRRCVYICVSIVKIGYKSVVWSVWKQEWRGIY